MRERFYQTLKQVPCYLDYSYNFRTSEFHNDEPVLSLSKRVRGACVCGRAQSCERQVLTAWPTASILASHVLRSSLLVRVGAQPSDEGGVRLCAGEGAGVAADVKVYGGTGEHVPGATHEVEHADWVSVGATRVQVFKTPFHTLNHGESRTLTFPTLYPSGTMPKMV